MAFDKERQKKGSFFFAPVAPGPLQQPISFLICFYKWSSVSPRRLLRIHLSFNLNDKNEYTASEEFFQVNIKEMLRIA